MGLPILLLIGTEGEMECAVIVIIHMLQSFIGSHIYVSKKIEQHIICIEEH